jgi:hypothetical protein
VDLQKPVNRFAVAAWKSVVRVVSLRHGLGTKSKNYGAANITAARCVQNARRKKDIIQQADDRRWRKNFCYLHYMDCLSRLPSLAWLYECALLR